MTRSPSRTVTVAWAGLTVIGWSGPGIRTCFSVIQPQPAFGRDDSRLRGIYDGSVRGRGPSAWHDPVHASTYAAAARPDHPRRRRRPLTGDPDLRPDRHCGATAVHRPPGQH